MDSEQLRDMSCFVIVEGLPKVPPNLVPKLLPLVKKKVAEEIDDLGGHLLYCDLVVDENLFGLGAAFVEVNTATVAEGLIGRLNGKRLDKSNVMIASSWAFADKLHNMSEAYTVTESADDAIPEEDIGVSDSFLYDRLARPQFIMKGGAAYDIEHHWLDLKTGKPDPVRKPNDTSSDPSKLWSELDKQAKSLQKGFPTPYPRWSPRGSCLLTVHSSGLRLWTGDKLSIVSELPHPNVRLVFVSPTEQYAVTHSLEMGFCFWDVRQAKKLRVIPGPADAMSWPTYKFSADDRYIGKANVAEGNIHIYEASTMRMCRPDPTKSYTVAVENLISFEWSPSNPKYFMYCVRGTDTGSWRVQLDSIVEYQKAGQTHYDVQTIVRRNTFGVSDRPEDGIRFQWHPDGTYATCRIVKQVGNNRTSEYQIVRVGASSASVEMLDEKCGLRGEVKRFSWQEGSDRFAVLIEVAKKQEVAFFAVERVGFKLLGHFPNSGHRIFWSPKTPRCIVLNENIGVSSLQVYGCDELNTKATFLREDSYPFIHDVIWDPSGRYFTTTSSALRDSNIGAKDAGFKIYNMNGERVFERTLEKFSHFLWRPLPPTILTKEHLAKIRRTLPEKSQKYLDEDIRAQKLKDDEVRAKYDKAEALYKAKMEEIFADSEWMAKAAVRKELRENSAEARRNAELIRGLTMEVAAPTQ